MQEKIESLVDRYLNHVTNNISQHIKAEKYKFDALAHFQATFNLGANDLTANLKDSLSKVGNLSVGVGYYPVSSICDIADNQPEAAREALGILFFSKNSEEERIANFQEIMIPLSKQFSHKNTSQPYNMDLRFVSLLLSLQSPDKIMYFKATQVDAVYAQIFGQKTGNRAADISRIIKANDLGKQILAELEKRKEFEIVKQAMYLELEHNLWFAQDVIWYAAHNENNLDALTQKIKKFMQDNPDWRNNEHWQLKQEQINQATKNFYDKFHPSELVQMNDEERLRWMPYREYAPNDGLSYMLEYDSVIGKMGGIGGGSAGKMGYYQGRDGNWKTISNKITTKEDVAYHRNLDVEVLARMYEHIEADDFLGLKQYIDGLAADIESDEKQYKALVPSLIWVRKYFAILFPDKFIELYGKGFINKLETIAGIGKIESGDGKNDYSLWYSQTNKIASLAKPLNLTNYELSRILWELTNSQAEAEEIIMQEENAEPLGLNTIIYGPPGTGKTYSIGKYKKSLLEGQRVENSKSLELLSTWGDAVLSAYIDNNYSPLSINDIASNTTVRAFAKTKNSRIHYGTIATYIIENATEESTASKYRRGTDKFVKQDGKWALTELGRSEAEELDKEIKREQTVLNNEDNFCVFTTFHQSYSYEEFVEGIRPEVDDSGQIHYEIRDGIFKKLSKKAIDDPNNNYLLVIDEINRGNISKIFGELITLIEPNKRIGASEQILATLPYSNEVFGVPSNLYIIGTMNTTDKSIALLDIALRRRFNFIEIMPNPLLLQSDLDGVDLQQLLIAINNKIAEKIGRNYQIGHSYLMNINSISELSSAWYQKIIPLVQEYFYDDIDELQTVLKSFIDDSQIAILHGEDFKAAIKDLYEETQTTDNGIQL